MRTWKFPWLVKGIVLRSKKRPGSVLNTSEIIVEDQIITAIRIWCLELNSSCKNCWFCNLYATFMHMWAMAPTESGGYACRNCASCFCNFEKRTHDIYVVPFCNFCCHCLLFLSPGGVFLKSFVYCEIWMLVAITWMHIFLIAQLLRNTSGNGLSVIMMVVRNAEISFLKWALHWLHCAAQCWFWPFWFFFFSLYLKLWMLELWLGT